jgi:hypothetical protein
MSADKDTGFLTYPMQHIVLIVFELVVFELID